MKTILSTILVSLLIIVNVHAREFRYDLQVGNVTEKIQSCEIKTINVEDMPCYKPKYAMKETITSEQISALFYIYKNDIEWPTKCGDKVVLFRIYDWYENKEHLGDYVIIIIYKKNGKLRYNAYRKW